jgi:hypothetical protein
MHDHVDATVLRPALENRDVDMIMHCVLRGRAVPGETVPARSPHERVATWVYPGHGDDTTVGRERPRILDWRARGW